MPPRVILALGTLATIVALGAGTYALRLPVELFFLAILVVFAVAMFYGQRWILDVEERAFDTEANRVATPIRAVPGDENLGPVELAHRDRILAQIVETLGAEDCEREHRIYDDEGQLKTKVDLVARIGATRWYVTLKIGMNSQTRKIMQGEVEDIIIDRENARDRKEPIGDVRILMVVAAHDDDRVAHRQIRSLYKYADHRMAAMTVSRGMLGSYRLEVRRTDWPRRTDRAAAPRLIPQPA